MAFEIRARETAKTGATPRPRWTTDPELYVRGIAPGDETYAVPGTAGLPEVKTDYRFVRGHMCPKETAERISPEAGRETHTLLNAVPQLQWQNNGIWKELESLCLDWADKYGRLWVVCGPVFFGGSPSLWLGQGPEKRAAVPDALFKIVIRETPGGPDGGEIETLAFLIPNILPKEKKNPGEFLTSIQRIEGLAGLRFFSHVPAYPLENKSRPGDLRGW